MFGFGKNAKKKRLMDAARISVELIIEGSGSSGLTILSGTSGEGGIKFGDSGDNDVGRIVYDHSADDMLFLTSGTTQFTIKSDGRGLSQFTAKAWINFNGSSTVAIRDSHNVSSITDDGTGLYRVNFSNNLANANYSATSMSKDSRVVSFGDAIAVPTTALFQIRVQKSWDAAETDNDIICLQVFGD